MFHEKTKPQYYYKPDSEGGFNIYSLVFSLESKSGLKFENWVAYEVSEDDAIKTTYRMNTYH